MFGLAGLVAKGATPIWRSLGGGVKGANRIRTVARGIDRLPSKTIPTLNRVRKAGMRGLSPSGGRLGRAADYTQEFLTAVPWKQLKTPGGAAAGGFVGATSIWGLSELAEDPYAPMGAMMSERDMIRQQQEMARYSYAGQMLDQLRRKQAIEALMRLAKADPHLYNEILAGEQLAEGEMVFGGSPRLDLMETLAYDMVDGSYPQQPDPEAELMQLLQGTV